MILDELIYDRTIADVNQVLSLIKKGYDNMTSAEKQLWDTDLKGALNASDLNRVLEACEYIALELQKHGYYARLENARPNLNGWTESDMQTQEMMVKWLHNVKQALVFGANLDLPTTTNKLDYIGQNNIEKHLHNTPQYMKNREMTIIHAGTVFAGFQGGTRR